VAELMRAQPQAVEQLLELHVLADLDLCVPESHVRPEVAIDIAPRFVAFLGPIVAGTMITRFGGYGEAATIVGLIYVVGMIAVRFLPETNGKPLPDN
jgi:hypothetical protein